MDYGAFFSCHSLGLYSTMSCYCYYNVISLSLSIVAGAQQFNKCFKLDSKQEKWRSRETAREGRCRKREWNTKLNAETAQSSMVTHCHPDLSKAKETDSKGYFLQFGLNSHIGSPRGDQEIRTLESKERNERGRKAHEGERKGECEEGQYEQRAAGLLLL